MLVGVVVGINLFFYDNKLLQNKISPFTFFTLIDIGIRSTY